MPNSSVPPFHSLRVRELALWVRLGCSVEERAHTQEVRVNVEIRFPQPPPGAVSDHLDGTVCYGRLSEALARHCVGREFRLIERMALDFYGVARDVAGPQVSIAVEVHKVRPPVEHLHGGAIYRCGDFAH